MSDPGRTDERRITAVLHGWGVAAISTEDGAGQRLRHLPAWEFARNLATALAGSGGDGASVRVERVDVDLLREHVKGMGALAAMRGWQTDDAVIEAGQRVFAALDAALAAAGATGEGGGEG
jgi:hypothetical protein